MAKGACRSLLWPGRSAGAKLVPSGVAEMMHQDLDARSLALHKLVAHKLRRDPSLLTIAKANIARWEQRGDPGERTYLDDWKRVLDAGIETALTLATEVSERAAALRQSSPFAGILSPSERST